MMDSPLEMALAQVSNANTDTELANLASWAEITQTLCDSDRMLVMDAIGKKFTEIEKQ